MNANINGVGGAIQLTHKGTIKWSFQGNEGRSHTFLIKDSYYAPNAPCQLLSPQHWSQNTADNANGKGTWTATYFNKVKLHWANNRYHRTVDLDPATNIAAICSSPGHLKYGAFHALQSLLVPQVNPVCFDTQVVQEDDSSYDERQLSPLLSKEATDILTRSNTINRLGVTKDIQVEQQRTPTSEILRIHNQLNHLSFKTIQLMAAKGHFPKNLVDCQIPICSACMFGKLSRRPWRTKSQVIKSIKLCTYSGQCVSVDQLESPTPGLIAQLKGIPTTKRYAAATIFVDHFSRLSFVHPQTSLSSEDTLQAKWAFERYCGSHNVKIQHYHADNGRFVDKLFIEDIRSQTNRSHTVA